MLNYEEIKEYCTNYKVENGLVYNKNSNQQVIDEDTILKVKSSILIFKEAHSSYEEDVKQFGKTNKSQEDYVLKTMEKFGVNGESNTYGINKLVNAIVTSNGHYEEMMSGNDLTNSKFSILVAPKQEYGLAFLKLKFREKGLDIDNLTINQDLSELKHNGVSKVIIDFKIKEYKKEQIQSLDNNPTNLYSHPKAKELNELEHQKQIARQNNDEVAYNYAQQNIERIIRENPASVTPEEWDNMSIDSKLSFIRVKINESKILHDQDSFNYWNANLKTLESKRQEDTIYEYNTPIYNNSNQEVNKKDSTYYYQQIINAINKRRNEKNISEAEKKQIIGEIFYNQGYLIENINTEEEIRTILTSVVNDLKNDDFEIKIQNSIISDIQEKLLKLKPSKNETMESKKQNENQNDLSILIGQLKNKMEVISNEYKQMLLDGYIDDNELSILINRFNELSDNVTILKSVASNEKEIELLNLIAMEITKEKQKMTNMQSGIQESISGFSR